MALADAMKAFNAQHRATQRAAAAVTVLPAPELPPTALEYAEAFTLEDAILYCTVLGRGRELKTRAPESNGRAIYVWRMARFHAGLDTTMPVTCLWALAESMENFTGQKFNTGILGPMERAVCKHLDTVADELLAHLGLSRDGAARKWRSALSGTAAGATRESTSGQK